jgi:hypothetical protein
MSVTLEFIEDIAFFQCHNPSGLPTINVPHHITRSGSSITVP